MSDAKTLAVVAWLIEKGLIFGDRPVRDKNEAERSVFKRQDGAIVSPLVRLSEAQSIIDRLTAERDALIADARRYRWLRSDGLSHIRWDALTDDTCDIGLDYAIDRAAASLAGETKEG